MSSFGWSLFYVGIVSCLLWIVRYLARIEDHLGAMRRRLEREDANTQEDERPGTVE